MNMTKKGDKHMRILFIHGARTVVRGATNNNDSHMNQWGNQLKERRGFNKPTVVVVNKNARIIWSMLRNVRPTKISLSITTPIITPRIFPMPPMAGAF